MTPSILEQVRELADDPAAAEKLCGKMNVEFHPVYCDVVCNAAEPGTRCWHVNEKQRKEREAAYEAATNRAAPKVKPKKPSDLVPPPLANTPPTDASTEAKATEALAEVPFDKSADEPAPTPKADKTAKAEEKAAAKVEANAKAADEKTAAKVEADDAETEKPATSTKTKSPAAKRTSPHVSTKDTAKKK